jgi:hypothetical protein
MLSERMLGALLSLLIDHYVLPENKGIMLAATPLSRQLQFEHMEDNSLAMQYILYVEETEPLGAEAALIGQPFSVVVQGFQTWRLKLNDLQVWDTPMLLSLFRPVLQHVRKSARQPGKSLPVKVRYITEFKQDTLDLIASVKEEEDVSTPMVED